jgi:hypothetical protein
MMNFAETLKTLPSIDHLIALELVGADGHVVATIENQPGRKGSLAVYAALATRHGGKIGRDAALEGLRLFAEHTEDARKHPGSHPNIDRLVELADSGRVLTVRLIERA